MLILLGIFLILLGIVIVVVGSFLTASGHGPDANTAGGDVKVAVGGFIGPIPFGFSNDRTLLYLAVGLSAFFMVLYVIFHFMR